MSKQKETNPDEIHKTIRLRLNPQQRDLLQRAVAAEGLTSIEALVRLAISQSDEAAVQKTFHV
jgi:uncharacterized protein (DUF1778 family)